MILDTQHEALVTARKQGDITLLDLAEKAREIGKGWKDNTVINESGRNFEITDDLKLQIINDRGVEKSMDMTYTAFSQLCTRLGVPAQYLRKCAKTGKMDLVRENIRGWADKNCGNFVVREHGGVARSVVSTDYTPYTSDKILRALSHTVDKKRFVPEGVYLSTDRLHVRMVDFNPLPIKGESSPLYAGFCVDSSDVGRGSLNMKFFIYRLACTNGLMVSKGGGTLFRLHHVGERMTESKIEKFAHSMRDIDRITGQTVEIIGDNQNRKLSYVEAEALLEAVKGKLSLSEIAVEKMRFLMSKDGAYDMSRWGLINSLTEVAQKYTLDTRIDIENFAGDMLYR